MINKRESGVLLHPTSLPSQYGVGGFGTEAAQFIDWLAESRQRYWQILPLNPTGYGNSPYQSTSVFAISEIFICPNTYPIRNLLNEEPPYFNADNEETVDYTTVFPYKHDIFRRAFLAFKENPSEDMSHKFTAFCKANNSWLDDFTIFTAIKKHFDGLEWTKWPSGLAEYTESTVTSFTQNLEDEIKYYKFLQFAAFTQWAQVKEYAKTKNIKIIGDLPIFTAFDSSDCWANKELFQIKQLSPTAVAGVPPDYFSEDGQLWGNPLYDWDAHQSTGYAWWLNRLSQALELFDMIRIDHFRGFESYWSNPPTAKDARCGEWIKAPGIDFFNTVIKILGKNWNQGETPIIAEDLGIITPAVTALREKFGFPGMKILQFGMEDAPQSSYLPHNFDNDNIVVYTGTHDNNTTVGWYNETSEKTRDYFRRYLNVSGDTPHLDLLRLLFSCPARLVIFPIQDLLGLDETHRMNTPGTASGNWRFRLQDDAFSEKWIERLVYLSELYGRN
ncbi:MAG: 4-alpha-glucanotransferase [Defluviitaleaceae bacterium]|nr:4-alpha-glucanotransferase [Defluviitaleaceae bacterium]